MATIDASKVMLRDRNGNAIVPITNADAIQYTSGNISTTVSTELNNIKTSIINITDSRIEEGSLSDTADNDTIYGAFAKAGINLT
jgi:hypothetical protein